MTETFDMYSVTTFGVRFSINPMQGFRFASPPAYGLSSFQDLLYLLLFLSIFQSEEDGEANT